MVTLAEDLALALDPATLMAKCGVPPDPWQVALLQADTSRILMLCCRQSGKSTVAAIMALHTALYEPPALILLLSPSERQSKELFKKVTTFYSHLDKPVAPEVENRLELELENGSRIVALPGKEGTVRSFSGVRVLIIDEAARVTDDLYKSVRPMLAVSQGRLVTLSTPFGKRGFFFREWTEGRNWHRVKITAHDCPRISPTFLEEERTSLGDWWFQQEYLCEFVETVDQVFSYDLVMGAVSAEVRPLFGGGVQQ